MNTAVSACSHTAPQLLLGNILSARGHNVTFASYSDTLASWLKDYPSLHPISLGENSLNKTVIMESCRRYLFSDTDADPVEFAVVVRRLSLHSYASKFKLFSQWIKDNAVDVVVCDFLNYGRYDAARYAKRPFVATTPMLGGLGNYVPDKRLYHWSDLCRFYNAALYNKCFQHNLINLRACHIYGTSIRYRSVASAVFAELLGYHYKKRYTMSELGVTPYTNYADCWRHGIVLVNSFFGFETPQPLPANTFIIGLFMPPIFAPLSNKLREFLDMRK
ncbi:hypothetical protein BDF19DRAFT_327331 [Syncephalis fuscata]|nr:hypothetical protein BDF19DRAFT_327331 [Syncephalis fuscata]